MGAYEECEELVVSSHADDAFELKNQLCFPLYACAKEVIRHCKPCLDELDLTYTQYITMMVLWDCGQTNVKELGQTLFLDSGTLTPVLKKLEAKGYIHRSRSKQDERSLVVTISEKGKKLKERAADVPEQMKRSIHLTEDEAQKLYVLLYKVIEGLSEEE